MAARKRRNPGGRPSAFTLPAAIKLVAWLNFGLTIEAAAAKAGIGATTAFRWLAWARAGRQPYATLLEVITPRRLARLRNTTLGGPAFRVPANGGKQCGNGLPTPETSAIDFRELLSLRAAGGAAIGAPETGPFETPPFREPDA